MRLRRPRFLSSAKRTFPSLEQASFPGELLLLQYLSGLVRYSPLHSEFLALVMQYTGFEDLLELVQQTFSGGEPDPHIKRLVESGDEHDLVHHLERMLDSCLYPQQEKELRESIRQYLEGIDVTVPEQGSYGQRLSRVKEVLGLSEEDTKVLELCVCYQTCHPFESYCDQYSVSDWPPLMAAALSLTVSQVSASLVLDGSLQDKRLIKMQRCGVEVLEPLLKYLQGLAEDFLDQSVFAVSEGPTYPLESFPIETGQLELMREAVGNPGPAHLFFYGRPGTGKTEMARSLAAQAGLTPFLVRYGNDGDGRERRMALNATLSVAPPNSLVIVDEADVLLNDFPGFRTGKVDKGWVNQFIDNCPLKVIWISNLWEFIPESILRRFDYSLEFRKFSERQRRSAWEMQLREQGLHRLVPAEMIDRLVRRYQVNAGGIASALGTVKRLYGNLPPAAGVLEVKLGELLSQHEKLTGNHRPGKNLMPIQAQYDVQALHTDLPVERLISGLQNRKQKLEQGGDPYPAAVLFWGVPGTGKTEFAKYLAAQLEQELLCKRMSDLQSKYVGETEKNIAKAFAEAEEEGAVLLLDEADSLFLDRREVRYSWEKSQTNELLTRMENFTGVCICCTNLLDLLDGAALRRFAWKVEFRALTPEGRERLFRRYFQSRGALSGKVREGLASLRDLTPGDFKVVAQQAKFTGETLTPAEAVKALRRETAYKQPAAAPLGFGIT